jgi:hypothetical protein
MTLAKSGFHFVDRAGRLIDRDKWQELSGDADYRVLREFDNGIVHVSLVWSGVLNRREFSAFRETWPVYMLRVANYHENGSTTPDPVMDGKAFPDEGSAIKGYEDFLIQWTACEIDDKGVFVERDNQLAPPPPPNPDTPQSVLKLGKENGNGSEFVAW